jgi:hypothetical protein
LFKFILFQKKLPVEIEFLFLKFLETDKIKVANQISNINQYFTKILNIIQTKIIERIFGKNQNFEYLNYLNLFRLFLKIVQFQGHCFGIALQQF